jgi:non-specific serine/threonine protein kinase
MDETTTPSGTFDEACCDWPLGAEAADEGPKVWRMCAGAAVYDEGTAELRVHGRLIGVEPGPLKLLSELLRARETMSREALVARVWDGPGFVDEHVLAKAVRRLRTALKGSGVRVVTVPRLGYRLDRGQSGGPESQVLRGLEEMALDDIMQLSSEELLDEAREEAGSAEAVQTLVSSLRARVEASMDQVLAGAGRRKGTALPCVWPPACAPEEAADAGDDAAAALAESAGLQEEACTAAAPLNHVYLFGAAEFDEARHELRLHGERVQAAPLLLKLLSELLRAGGDAVPAGTLLERVWGDVGARLDEAAVRQAVTRLRRVLGDDGLSIHRMPGDGYRFDFRGSGALRCSTADVHRSPARLRRGEPVPHRPQFILERDLGLSQGVQMWLARDAAGEERVFKFATDSVSLSALKHELAVLEWLQKQLPQRQQDDLARLYSYNDSAERPPCFLELQQGGQDLASWAAQDGQLQVMSDDERVGLVCRIAEVLRVLHGADVVYGDLRPRNILIAGRPGRWRVRLANFAACQLGRADRDEAEWIDPMSGPVGVAVNPRALFYRAPELSRGDAPTQQSDVYALGVILYQVLAGDFTKTPSPGYERDIKDPLLLQVIAAATDLEPARRLTSVEQLVQRLESLPQRRSTLQIHETDNLSTSPNGGVTGLVQQVGRMSEALHCMRRQMLFAGVLCTGVFVAVLAALQISRYQAVERADALVELSNAAYRTDGRRDDVDAVLRGRFASDPVTRAARLRVAAKGHFGRGEFAEAEIAQREAIKLLEQARGPYDHDTLMGEYELVRTLDVQHHEPEADSLLAQADQHAGVQLQGRSDVALLALWARAGHELIMQGAGGALAQYERIDQLRLQADPDEPDGTRKAKDLLDWVKAHMEYALALSNQGRHAEAEGEALDVVKHSAAAGEAAAYVTGVAWEQLAGIRLAAGRFSQALEAERQAYAIMKDRVAPHATLVMLGSMGALEYLSGQSAPAVQDLRDAHEQMADTLGKWAPLTQLVAFHLAVALRESGGAADADLIAARLQPSALTAADAGVNWDLRLKALRGDIALRTGRKEEGARLLQEVAQEQIRSGENDWLLRHLQRTSPTSLPGGG